MQIAERGLAERAQRQQDRGVVGPDVSRPGGDQCREVGECHHIQGSRHAEVNPDGAADDQVHRGLDEPERNGEREQRRTPHADERPGRGGDRTHPVAEAAQPAEPDNDCEQDCERGRSTGQIGKWADIEPPLSDHHGEDDGEGADIEDTLRDHRAQSRPAGPTDEDDPQQVARPRRQCVVAHVPDERQPVRLAPLPQEARAAEDRVPSLGAQRGRGRVEPECRSEVGQRLPVERDVRRTLPRRPEHDPGERDERHARLQQTESRPPRDADVRQTARNVPATA